MVANVTVAFEALAALARPVWKLDHNNAAVNASECCPIKGLAFRHFKAFKAQAPHEALWQAGACPVVDEQISFAGAFQKHGAVHKEIARTAKPSAPGEIQIMIRHPAANADAGL